MGSTEFLAVNAALIPVIVALVQGFKGVLNMDSKYAGLLSLVFGVALSILVTWVNGDEAGVITSKEYVVAGIVGVLTGLSAAGLYSQVKSAVVKEIVE